MAHQVIDTRYRVLAKIKSGGMGDVFRVHDRLSGQRIALKMVNVGNSDGSRQVSQYDTRFALAREFQTLAALRHPYIVSVLDYGFDAESGPYFTMELLEDALPITEAVLHASIEVKTRYLVQILQALEYLHRHQIVHRDLKPDNVLVHQRVRLLDFGLAGVGRMRGHRSGTMAYMAPETLSQSLTTTQSDLYSLGVIAYQMFAGELPFEAQDVMGILYQPPDMAALQDLPIVPVIECLLQKDPAKRYQSARDTLQALFALNPASFSEAEQGISESFLKNAPFVGREAELQALMGALDGVLHGQGGLWLIAGESGVGKTRLLRELRTRALVAGATVMQGESVEDGGFAYHTWQPILSQLALSSELAQADASVLKEVVPDIESLLERDVPDAPPVSGTASQLRLLQTILKLLDQQRRPMVVFFEDLQWAGESLTLLQQIIPTTQRQPLLIIGTFRDDETPELAGQFPEAHLLNVYRMGTAAISQLASAMLGDIGTSPALTEYLQQQAGGNAFFLVEIVRALAAEAGDLNQIDPYSLPEKILVGGIQRLMRRRLSRLPQHDQRLTKLAAVTGREVELPLLQTTADAAQLEQWLLNASQIAVLEVQNNQWRFAHDKLRHAILADLTDDERVEYHQMAASSIEAVHPDNLQYASHLADHWYETGNNTKALHYATLAAEQDIRHGKLQRAQHYARRVLELLSDTDRGNAYVRAYNRLGDIARRFGDYDSALASYELAQSLAETLSDAVQQAAALTEMGWIYQRRGDITRARDLCERALELASTGDDVHVKIRCLHNCGIVERFGARLMQARDYFLRGVELASAAGLQQVMGELFNALGLIVLHLAQYQDAKEWFTKSVAIAREVGDLWIVTVALHNLGVTASSLGQYDTARHHMQETMDVDLAMGDRLGVAFHLAHMGFINLSQGQPGKAKQCFDECETLARDIGDTQVMTIVLRGRGMYHMLTNEFALSHDYFQQSIDLSRQTRFEVSVTAGLAEIGWLSIFAGNDEQAAHDFAEGLERCRKIDDRWSECEIISGQTQLAIRAGRREEALHAIIQMMQLAQAMTSPVFVLEAIVNVAALFAAEQPVRSYRWLAMVANQSETRAVTRKLIGVLQPPLVRHIALFQASIADKEGRNLRLESVQQQVLQECQQALEMLGTTEDTKNTEN